MLLFIENLFDMLILIKKIVIAELTALNFISY